MSDSVYAAMEKLKRGYKKAKGRPVLSLVAEQSLFERIEATVRDDVGPADEVLVLKSNQLTICGVRILPLAGVPENIVIPFCRDEDADEFLKIVGLYQESSVPFIDAVTQTLELLSALGRA